MCTRLCTHPWEYYSKPFKIIDNLYYIGTKRVSVHLLKTDYGLVIIDSAFPQTVYQILENIRLLGFEPSNIKAIIHTHAHYDHCGGTKAIKELTGAKTYLGSNDITIIEKEHHKTLADYYGMVFYEQFAIDYPITDNQKIEYGNTVIKCVSAPGHTCGTMAFFFEVSENGYSYKVGLHGGPGTNTLSRDAMEKYGIAEKNREDYLKTLEKLKKIEVDIMLGAHPNQNNTFGKYEKINGISNPFINSSDWPLFIQTLETDAKKLFLNN